MSEDNYSQADNSTVQPHIPGKHRHPRFTWNPAYEVTFFRSLCDSVRHGLREGMTFKPEAWERAAQALRDKHGAYADKHHLINKSDNARKKYRMWVGLKESPEFYYDPLTKTITGSDEAWDAHIKAEPFSKPLRGRPFEYEDFYEILFPDVIGTGGAPKRVTTRKRKTPGGSSGGMTGSDPIEHDTPGTNVMNMLAGATYGSSNDGGAMSAGGVLHHQQSQHQQGPARPSTTNMPPPPSPAGAQQQQQRPISTALPPRTSVTSTSALTPPEEAPLARGHQHFLAPGGGDPQRQRGGDMAVPPNKRRRGPDYLGAAQPSPSANGAYGPSSSSQQNHDGIHALADALRAAKSGRPGWSEQALDIFFRDFGEEDMDLQIKIAEKALAADENKAMVFVKMPLALRQHWVKRLREVHNGHNRT